MKCCGMDVVDNLGACGMDVCSDLDRCYGVKGDLHIIINNDSIF